jgi:uncharacterized protein (TIGR03545 family)
MTKQNETHGKKKKPKGPIRTGAVIPFAIIVVLIWAYFFFFFDHTLRKGLEYGLTQANGAEVNIGRVHTSFWGASLEIDKIQITDALKPEKNKLQVGEIHWRMLWDALLRGKIAIDDASILEISLGVPRAKPGRVIPPEPPSGQSALDKIRQKALTNAQAEFSQNVLGDTASILNGTDPTAQLGSVADQLKSTAKVKELQNELTKKQAEWKQRLDSLPQGKEFDALQARIKEVKFDHVNSPAEIQAAISQLDSIYKDAQAKYQVVESTGNGLNSDVAKYQSALKDVQALVAQDIKDLEGRLKIPKLDIATISKTIFGPLFLIKVKQAEFYMNKSRQLMPTKKTAEEKAEFRPPTAPERAKGRNYKFGRPFAYPLFWLKHAAISSKATKDAEWSGNIIGSLQDITDDPSLVGRPMIASFKGDFPTQEVSGVDGKITIDHTTETALERFNLKVESFPIQAQSLIDSPEVQLGFEKAIGTSEFNAELKDMDVSISSNSTFRHATMLGSSAGSAADNPGPQGFLKAEAKQPVLAEILKGAVAEVPTINLKAAVHGPWSALEFDIDSNLGRDLSAAFEKQIAKKINEARAKLKSAIDEQVGKQKAQLEEQFNKIKAQVDSLLKSKEADVKKVENSADQAKNDAVKSQGKHLEEQGKKVLDQLKDQFKF